MPTALRTGFSQSGHSLLYAPAFGWTVHFRMCLHQRLPKFDTTFRIVRIHCINRSSPTTFILTPFLQGSTSSGNKLHCCNLPTHYSETLPSHHAPVCKTCPGYSSRLFTWRARSRRQSVERPSLLLAIQHNLQAPTCEQHRHGRHRTHRVSSGTKSRDTRAEEQLLREVKFAKVLWMIGPGLRDLSGSPSTRSQVHSSALIAAETWRYLESMARAT